MKIPDVRARMRQLAGEHGIEELYDLAEELKRQPAVRRAPVQSASMTDELAAAIRAYAAAYPTASFTTIARVFEVNAGRVSEILRGKRE